MLKVKGSLAESLMQSDRADEDAFTINQPLVRRDLVTVGGHDVDVCGGMNLWHHQEDVQFEVPPAEGITAEDEGCQGACVLHGQRRVFLLG